MTAVPVIIPLSCTDTELLVCVRGRDVASSHPSLNQFKSFAIANSI